MGEGEGGRGKGERGRGKGEEGGKGRFERLVWVDMVKIVEKITLENSRRWL